MKLFQLMIQRPLPFLVIIPAIYIALTAVGWTDDNKIEDEVNNIWIPTSGAYYKNKEYADSLGRLESRASSFAAMARSRDGGNLFREERLAEIRARMQAAEATQIEYKGKTYTWDDLCISNNVGKGTAYKFPCFRLSPMDLFLEARWWFEEEDRVTWYQKVLQDRLVAPRIPRFGIMTSSCATTGATSTGDFCDEVIANRATNPKLLLSDIGDLENNHPCKVCIETQFEGTMRFLTSSISGTFLVMAAELKRAFDATGDPATRALAQKIGGIAQSMDRQQVQDFYSYYVTRTLYANLGAGDYIAGYTAFMNREPGEGFGLACLAANAGNTAACPTTVTPQDAVQQLLNHADNVFSSLNTAGNPFPHWGTSETGSAMFGGNFPLGGSGIDMSGTILSSSALLDPANYGKPLGEWAPLYGNATVDPTGAAWNALVETDPVYRWFFAGATPMTSHCGNEPLKGTSGAPGDVDAQTAAGAAALLTKRWCTKHDVPYEVDGSADDGYTQQHFARMFYDLVVASDGFLGVTQGESDPYVWTNGNGCGYELGGSRDPFTNPNETDILFKASRELYYVDEGVSSGALDRSLLLGGTDPAVGDYSFDNPLKTVAVLQSIYLSLIPKDIPARVAHCNRPEEFGGPILDLSVEDAEEILLAYKEAFEDNWVQGWDNATDGQVQFVGFFDDTAVIGTTGRTLEDITLSNGSLMAISIAIIAVFSAIFLFSFDFIESRVLVTLIGVALVLLSYFGGLGLGIIAGIKINITIAWTLPFIILGLGVDDMYIVLMALKKQGYSEEGFIAAMKEVVVPVSMTSLVNCSMFAVMNIVDVPAVYLTAQMALLAIIFLYFSVIFCYPAYCWIDMKRQASGRYDCIFCIKKKNADTEGELASSVGKDASTRSHGFQTVFYARFYKPLVLGKGPVRLITHIFVWVAALTLLGLGIWGAVDKRSVGLGLEDFFPNDHQAKVWASVRTEELASWSMEMNWGELPYNKSDTQLKLIKQFEGVVATPHVAEADTKQLWIADFNIWTTRQCTANFDREDPDVLACGMDQEFEEEDGSISYCSGYWVENTLALGLREKKFTENDVCVPNEEGICRPEDQMHDDDLSDIEARTGVTPPKGSSWCPVFDGWSDKKFEFCLGRWRFLTGGGGDLLLVDDDAEFPTENPDCPNEFLKDDIVQVPIRYSGSPGLYAIDLFSHEDTIDMIKQTRAHCDDDTTMHCWLSGIPFDYWEQYLWVEDILVEVGVAAIGVGFAVSALFLFFKVKSERRYTTCKVLGGSLVGALLISLTTALSLVTVVGLSCLADVNMTAFSDMSFVLSVGFAVEYSVHVVHRFLKAPMVYQKPKERVEYAMSFLALPTFMSFVSSTIGVVCLAFTDFEFNEVFFFRPLIIVMFVTYFYGCWFLPCLLCLLNWDILKLGKPVDEDAVVVDDDVENENKEQALPESPVAEEGQEVEIDGCPGDDDEWDTDDELEDRTSQREQET